MGYEFQYSIFATEIYNSLLNDSNQIEWIEFASNNAGKVDDVLIGLEKSVLAFQTKNIDSASFSYNTLTTSETQSILEGMFIGWKRIKTSNVNKLIDIRFITTQSPSENDKIKSCAGTPKPSFKEFVNNLWIPIKNGKYSFENLPAKWKPVFQEMIEVTKSSSSEFIEFIKCTTFVFNYQVPKLFDSYIERQRRIDIQDITKKIFQTIAQKGNVKFSKKDFLNHFGLSNRYESYYTHSFFVDENHYQSINETVNRLEALLKSYSKGYISLIGNAGSGKSTLLTKWLQNCNYRIFKYYAYVNTDMSYEFGFRGEAKTFLHDILIQIRQAKYSIQDRLPTDDFEDLQKHFNNELNKLSREEEKVIIIVDGLDHIEREQDVSKSLIGILPLPDSVPENVYFLLGSRTIENLEKLNVRIKDSLEKESRIINIKALSKLQTQSLLHSYNITLSEDLFEKLYVNTKGHPLFLRYTIEEIRSKGQGSLKEIVTQRIFSGDIYKEYKVFWDTYKTNEDFIEILGILSRLRHSFFNIDILNSFPKLTRESQYKINRLSENYFYKIGTTWQFFHNSFKEFLTNETAKNILTGLFDKSIDKAFHLKIAESIKQIDSEYKWNVIYHFFKAEEFPLICQDVSQDYFRQQWFEYRSYKLIKEDIQLSINASSKAKDIYCLFRCFISIFELKQRYINFNPSGYFETFHQLGKISLANSFVYDNVELLVSQKEALSYCVTLHDQGLEELAHDIFLRATPSYILNQSKSVNSRRYDSDTFREIDEIDLIKKWTKAACLFTPIDKILLTIKEISIENVQPEEKRDLYSECLSAILSISIRKRNWENLRLLEKIILNEKDKYDLFYFYFDIVSKLTNENDFYGHCLHSLQNWEIGENNPINRRLLIVNLISSRNIDVAKQIFTNLLAPNKVEKSDYSLDEADLLNYIFDYSRFFYITTREFATSPTLFLPNTGKHTKTAFYYAFAELGKSYAYIYHSYRDAAVGYYSSFENFLKLFHYGHSDYGYDYSVSENKSLLINLILKITSKISALIFSEILNTLSTEWEKNKTYWNTKHIQEIIDWVAKSGLNKTWCVTQLERIDSYAFEKGYLDERIDRGIAQIRLWCNLGLKDKGEAILNHIMNISLDVRGENDNQLDYIVEWINQFNSDMSKEIDFYLNKVNHLREKVNSRSHTPAKEILTLSLKYGNGFDILQYFLFEGLVDFGDCMETLLSYLTNSLPQYKKIVVKLFTRIVLAYDNVHYARNSFLYNLFNNPETLSIDELNELISEVNIYSITEHRNDYLLEIQDYTIKRNINLSDIGLDRKIKTKDRYTETKTDELQLDDGTILSMQALASEIKTRKQLNKIEKKAEGDRNFNWAGLYTQILKEFSDIEILEILAIGRHDPREVVSIAKGLIEKGRIEIVKEILYKTINNGEKYGWVTFYDGGSKIAPFELLSTIEEKAIFQNKILNDFSNSITSLDVQALEVLVKDAPKIWKLFSDNVDSKILYEEIIVFRNELLKTHPVDNNAPKVNGSTGDETLLAEAIFFILTMPSDFNYSLYEIFLEGYPRSKSIVDQILQRLYSEGYSLKYVKLLAIISAKYKDTLVEHKENIIKLLSHRRYDIFRISSRLLIELDVDPKDVPITEITEVPLVYNMEFEYKPSILSMKDLDLEHINKKGFLKETDDPLIFVKLYLTQIKMLSEETGIDVINIAYRVMALGKDLDFPSWCNSVSEEEIRKIYSARFDLEISYKRPRNQLVWDGLMKVVKELDELELIDEALANEISDEFDEEAYLIETAIKSGFVSTILEDINFI